MADDLLAPFVTRTIDAGRELHLLGRDIAIPLFLDLKRGATHPQEPIPLFGWYHNLVGRHPIPVFKRERDGGFAVFVVDLDDHGDRRVTLLHAGRIATYFTKIPRPGWHRGAAPIVEPRLKEFFK
jgi:hypothetical protein